MGGKRDGLRQLLFVCFFDRPVVSSGGARANRAVAPNTHARTLYTTRSAAQHCNWGDFFVRLLVQVRQHKRAHGISGCYL
jgi:hypothetical protein